MAFWTDTMEGSVPGNDNDTADTTKNKYYRYVGLTSEIQAGKSKSFSISDERGKSIGIAIFNQDGQYYAISNTCIHKGLTKNSFFATLL